MLQRTSFNPPLGEGSAPTLEEIVGHLKLWHSDTAATRAALDELRGQAEERASRLESPKAVREYVDFFAGFFDRAAADIERIAGELPGGVRREHVEALRQIASNAAAEQRRCLMFRDKWINRPLPYEEVRPLLTEISNQTRDQLADYREMNQAALRLETIAGPGAKPPAPDGRMDRRALFNRLVRRDPGAGT